MNLFRALLEKPWVPQTAGPMAEDFQAPPHKTALLFFLGVVAVLFALFVVAYYIRMELADWRPMPESPLLWLNTGVLFAASVVLQWTCGQLREGRLPRVRIGLLLGGLLTLGFVAGQLVVWERMQQSGYALAGNPANAFFYLLTGLHALHILGGLWVWTRAGIRLFSGAPLAGIRLAVELCALYWHFLLLVWLVLFALISTT